MPKENLGLFDTAPTRGEIQAGFAITGLLLAAMLLIFPSNNQHIGEIQAFIPATYSAIFVGELIIATLLYAQAAIFRSRGLSVLASSYVFTALLVIPYILTFPGVFSSNGLFGAGVSSAGWIMIFRRLAFPLAVIFYALSRRRETLVGEDAQRLSPNLAHGLLVAVVAAIALATLSIAGNRWLPQLFASRTEGIASNILIFNVLHLSLLLAAAATLFRTRRSVLDIWLLVALSALLVQSLLNLPLQVRFTLGWYSLHLLALVSHLVVLVALVGESNRLYTRLALSVAARERERDTRMMSMDAVAAAIAHEVGQPLAAVSLNASAAMAQLEGSPPNTAKAMESLHQLQDDGRRAFDVVKSVRAMFSKGMGVRSRFDLNDLTVETRTLLDREIGVHRVSVELDLDPELPRIEANRVQIQRILINLITNAIEAMKGSRRRVRNIGIRTARAAGGDVLLEVTDSGVGIPSDKIAEIFEPFVTSKKTGTGLGLSLCRTIVEEHGGKLWASSGNPHGVTFHLQIPVGRGTTP